MKHPGRFALTLLSASVWLVLAGCFSYTKEEHQTTVPAVDTPATTSSSTTTTTVPDSSTTIEKKHTTTYTNP